MISRVAVAPILSCKKLIHIEVLLSFVHIVKCATKFMTQYPKRFAFTVVIGELFVAGLDRFTGPDQQ